MRSRKNGVQMRPSSRRGTDTAVSDADEGTADLCGSGNDEDSCHPLDGGGVFGQMARERAERILKGARKSHDWEHTQRVVRLCQRIGRAEGADMEVLVAAAYLHDIGRAQEDESDGQICHAGRGAEMTSRIVQSLPMAEERRANIVHCVRSHRFRDAAAPQTLEAKVLFDADKLDAIGAVGIARAYMFAGEVGAMLHNPGGKIEGTEPYSKDDTGYREYMVKLRKIKDRMLTKTGAAIALERHRFMERFFDQLLAEHRCER